MRDRAAAALAALYEEMTAAGHGLAVVLSGKADLVGKLLAEHRPRAAALSEGTGMAQARLVTSRMRSRRPRIPGRGLDIAIGPCGML